MGRLLLVGQVVLLMWGELSCECGACCLGASFMWGDLSCGNLSLGQVVCNSGKAHNFLQGVGQLQARKLEYL